VVRTGVKVTRAMHLLQQAVHHLKHVIRPEHFHRNRIVLMSQRGPEALQTRIETMSDDL
jgi:hypothetical protein